jgi:hypothetical protein
MQYFATCDHRIVQIFISAEREKITKICVTNGARYDEINFSSSILTCMHKAIPALCRTLQKGEKKLLKKWSTPLEFTSNKQTEKRKILSGCNRGKNCCGER